ncbi:MAG TPA: Crp/Fnr family transcriptional regulator [Xanthobacteraceae bacterium]|nr:Crp/Fnr family transcriptional regulator [Xanthobacteraceae bacterium]
MLIHSNDLRSRNLFLTALRAAEYDLLAPHLLSCDLRVGKRLHHGGDEIEDVIFPNSGVVVLTTPLREGGGAAVLMVGRDGVIGGLAAAASAPPTCDAEVQIGGEASRVPASIFRHALNESPHMRRLAARFDHYMLAQAQQTALCNASHPVEGRVCRWLLEIHDRSGSNKVPLTQNTLAQMLGVRRTTVTLVAGRLETAGVLTCRRGFMQIQNREKLEQRSCECYAQLKGYLGKLTEIDQEVTAPTAAGSRPIETRAARVETGLA